MKLIIEKMCAREIDIESKMPFIDKTNGENGNTKLEFLNIMRATSLHALKGLFWFVGLCREHPDNIVLNFT